MIKMMKKFFREQTLFIGMAMFPLFGVCQSINVKIDGSKKYQQLDGIGVNANTRSWNGNELKPTLDLLIDSLRSNIWRVIVESVEKWEDENDDNDPFTFNWNYYNKLYETPKFRKAWGMIRYLNSRGITDNLMINFMGPVPEWMGKKTIKPGYEDEYVEMITSFFYYARFRKHLKFSLVSPTNESDWRNEGPEIDEFAYAKVMRKLIDRMEKLGMGDVRYVGPDPASMQAGIQRYIPELMKDPVIMSKMAHIGVHSYGGYYANIDSSLKNSKYPNSTWWVTEWNAWRDGLDDGKIGVYDYTFASQCVYYLLDLLKNNASGLMEWEAYDSYYEHHYPSLFSYWGIFGYNKETKDYTPRKHFHTIRQITKYVEPGSWRVNVQGGDSLRMVSFYDTTSGKLTIVGMNTKLHPVEMNGSLLNITVTPSFEMTYTDSLSNMVINPVTKISDRAFKTTVPPNCIFAITTQPSKAKKVATKAQPSDWYTGDIHVHRNCGDEAVLDEARLPEMMATNNLDVISVLADMGNGEVKNSREDLKKINGKDAPQSKPGRIVHWDAEWHWDATYSNFDHQALGGHLVILGLKEGRQIWAESPYKVLEWAKEQNAVKGFCHLEYLNDSIQNELNCCIPIDFPVEAALGNLDFVAEDVYGTNSPNNGNYNSEAAMNAYYKLLNCGFRIGLAAGTDYPCNENEPLGKLLTYVNVKGKLTYRNWIDGIKKGKTVVSRDGSNEFLELKINNTYSPGDEMRLKGEKTLAIQVKWTSVNPADGTIELVSNGKVIASQKAHCAPGKPATFKVSEKFAKSSWICARRMDATEHITHTAPVYITVDGKPVRASADDARFFATWIDNIQKNIVPGGKWNKYFTDLPSVQQRYEKAQKIYSDIASASEK
jgi:hypothetical protein